MENKDIYQELQTVRSELSNAGLNKSGKNKFAGFDYFELADFLPKATELFLSHGLTPIFRMEFDEVGIEYAYLTIIKGNEQVTFKTPTANPRPDKTPNPIQELGSKITYMRRYLYLIALDIVESDSVDATIGAEKAVQQEFPTPGMIADIVANKDLLKDELKKRKIKDSTALKQISKTEAEELIKIINDKKANTNEKAGS